MGENGEDMQVDAHTVSAILKRVSDMFEEKLGGLKRALVEEQKSLSMKIDKRFKTTEKTFKSRSNKIQFELNTDTIDSLSQAKVALQDPAPSVSSAVRHLDEGMEALAERNRMIELCEVSEHGWLTVDEYCKRPLAEDSDDDTRMRRAEGAAGRKKKALSQRGKSKSFRRNNSNNYNNYHYQNGYGYQNDTIPRYSSRNSPKSSISNDKIQIQREFGV